MKINNRTLTKSALSGSILILLLWLLLGTTTTVTWFTDTDDAVNEFTYGKVKISVEYWDNTESDWITVSSNTPLFDDQVLYEPGYTQIVRLKIRNDGDVPFDYRLSVNVNQSYGTAVNYYGEIFQLAKHLKFGVVFDRDYSRLVERTSSRALAQVFADQKMDLYDLNTSYAAVDGEGKSGSLESGKEEYAALVVTMPTAVGNEANYRGTTKPSVELGIKVLASQQGTIQNIN